MGGTLVTPVNVRLACPTVVGEVESSTVPGSLLVTVMLTGLGGVLCKVTLTCACRLLPTAKGPGIVIAGAVTVAVTDKSVAGVLNPEGWVTVMFAVPAAFG